VARRMSGHPIPLAGHNLGVYDLAARVARFGNVAPPAFAVPTAFAEAAAFWSEMMFGFAGTEPPAALRAVPLIADGRPMAISAEQRTLGVEPRPLDTTVRDAVRWHRSGHARSRRVPV
jgi:hypothetical protein